MPNLALIGESELYVASSMPEAPKIQALVKFVNFLPTGMVAYIDYI